MSILVLRTSVFLEALAAAMHRLAPGERIVAEVDPSSADAIDALVAFNLPAGIVARLPRLRLVASPGAGADELVASGEIPPHVPITRVRDPRQSTRMAQHVALAVLRWHRQPGRYEAQQRERRWSRHLTEPEQAWTAGLMGLGDQGRAIARALLALGYPVRAWTRTAHDEPGIACFAGDAAIAAFLDGTRVLVCALPSTPRTKGLVDARVLAALAPGAYLVDVSRGGVVDHDAVLEAVRSGRLAGAALDVFAQEPLPADSPLWTDARIAVTPHVAAMPDVDAAARQILDNVARARRGEPLANVVDRARGY